MDRRKKRRRAPTDALISTKPEDDNGADVNRPSVLGAQASSASFQGPDRANMEAERPSRRGKKKASASSAANGNHETWSKKWKGIFPADLIQEVGERRNQSTLLKSEPTDSTQPYQRESVYFVFHSVTGGYAEQDAKILGTYTNVASANEHVMVHFAKDYGDYGLKDDSDEDPRPAFPRSKMKPDMNCACWDTDKDGCLILEANMYKWGNLKFAALKQPILHEPPVF